jgi:PGF-CTERM protein
MVVTSVFAGVPAFTGTAAADAGTVSGPASDVEIGSEAEFTVEDPDQTTSTEIVYFSDTDATFNRTVTRDGDGTNATFNVGTIPIVDDDLDGSLADEVNVSNASTGLKYNVTGIEPVAGDVTVENAPPAGADNVRIEYTRAPESQSINPDGGSATATIGTSSSSSPNDDDVLQVTDGDTITAAYWDDSEDEYQSTTVGVTAANTPPTANDDSVTINATESVVIAVLDNDDDTDGSLNASTVTVVSQPSDGTTTVYDNGSVRYTHTGEETDSTTDSFTYEVDDDDGNTSNTATVEVTVDAAAPDEEAPEYLESVHYDEDTGDDETEIEVSFSEPVQNLGDARLYIDDAPQGTLSEYASDISNDDGRYVATVDDDQVNNGDIQLRLTDDVTDDSGNELSNTGNKTVATAPVTVSSSRRDVTAFVGSSVAIVADDDQTPVEITDGNFFRSGSTGLNSNVYVFETANRETDDYDVEVGSGGSGYDAEIVLRQLGLDVDIDDENITDEDEIEGTITANAGNRPVTVELLDDDGDVVEGGTVTGNLDGQAEFEFSFDATDLDLEPGEYSVRVTDERSGVEAESDDVVVREQGEGTADIGGNGIFTEERGDVAEIEIEIRNTDTATLTIGDEDVGFVSNVTVVDDDGDGEVVLEFNTFAVTGLEGELSNDQRDAVFDTADDADDVESADVDEEYSVSSLLERSEYSLEVQSGERSDRDDTEGVGTLVLEERNTTSVQSWTAPSRISLDENEEVNEALANGNLTRDDEIAYGDLAVHRIEASGIEGAIAAEGDDSTDAFFDMVNDGTVLFTVEQTDPGPNRDPYELVLDDGSADVVADADNDTYYVVVDTDDVEATERSVSEDDSLTANFTVPENSDLADDEAETVLTEYELVEAEHEVEDPVEVSATTGQVLRGETNVAPGTRVDIRIRSSGDTRPPFIKTGVAYVAENGSFRSVFDFSEERVNDTFEVVVRGGAAGTLTVDGSVVDDGETPTPTDTPTDTETPTDTVTPTETTDTPTATPTDTPTDTPTATPTETLQPVGTPGFGIPVAVVALLAAALLVSRRD